MTQDVFDAFKLYNKKNLGTKYSLSEINSLPNKVYVIYEALASHLHQQQIDKMQHIGDK